MAFAESGGSDPGHTSSGIAERIFLYLCFQVRILKTKSLADKGYSQIRSKILRKKISRQDSIQEEKQRIEFIGNLADKGSLSIRSKSLARKHVRDGRH